MNLLKGRLVENPGARAAVPGTIAAVSGAGIDVACGGGSTYRLLELQPESRKAMEARAYAAGGRVEAGEILG